MNDERIWAPWRIGYVSGGDTGETPPTPAAWRGGADQACFLCRAAAMYRDVRDSNRKNLVVEVTPHASVVLNRYPYTNGHLLISPLRHVGGLADLSDDEHLAAMHLLRNYTRRLATLIKAEGFNVGLNLGQAAGAGVPGHLHWHLVPRWPGDTNFMPALAGVRMISQSLTAMWESLVNHGGTESTEV